MIEYLQLPVLIALIILLFWRVRIVKWNDAYLDKCSTTAIINGFFLGLVFLHHFSNYAVKQIHGYVGQWLGQLIVVTFLFYSGYGCMVQLCKRGDSYLQVFPVKRILPTALNFWVAVAIFAIWSLVLGREVTLRQIVLSFTGWQSVGNSNWYIFAIVFLYIAFCVSFKMACGRRMVGLVILGIAVVFAICVLSRLKQPHWYNTMIVFWIGVAYGMFREKIESVLRHRNIIWFGALAVCMVVVFFVERLPLLRGHHILAFGMKSTAFALGIVLATMKIKFDNNVLRWCGERIFPIYIYQRIPMLAFITLDAHAFDTWRCWLYFAVSAVVTLAIAYIYPKFQISFHKVKG